MATSNAIRIEAEDMEIVYGYDVVGSAGFASDDAFVWLRPGNKGKFKTEFTGDAGEYEIVVHYFDENDGKSRVTVNAGGELAGFTMDDDLGYSRRGERNATETKTHDSVELSPGDDIHIWASARGGEYAAIDYIELIPIEAEQSTEEPPEAKPSAGLDGFERQVVDLTNALRARNGLDPLAVNAALSEAADGHSADMAAKNFFSHVGSDGDRVGDRVDDAGYDWTWVGENIAAGYATPDEVVAAWFDSPGHRLNMLSPHYTEIGVGFVDDGNADRYGEYWTQVFAAPADDLVA